MQIRIKIWGENEFRLKKRRFGQKACSRKSLILTQKLPFLTQKVQFWHKTFNFDINLTSSLTKISKLAQKITVRPKTYDSTKIFAIVSKKSNQAQKFPFWHKWLKNGLVSFLTQNSIRTRKRRLKNVFRK